jgi:FHA domain
MTVYPCPKGHQSTEADFCDQCGSRISQNLSATGLSSTPTVSTGAKQPDCPDCGTAKDPDGGSFCEICGYNFITKISGAIPVASPPPIPVSSQTSVQTPAPCPWSAIVTIDPTLQGPDSPPPPQDFAPLTIALDKPTLLIGRTSATRAVYPEMALDFDTAISTRHAILTQINETTWSLRDIGSANGTCVNGKEIPAMQDVVLTINDRITLGHWTAIAFAPKN